MKENMAPRTTVPTIPRSTPNQNPSFTKTPLIQHRPLRSNIPTKFPGMDFLALVT
jgi:hypothetical protein